MNTRRNGEREKMVVIFFFFRFILLDSHYRVHVPMAIHDAYIVQYAKCSALYVYHFPWCPWCRI